MLACNYRVFPPTDCRVDIQHYHMHVLKVIYDVCKTISDTFLTARMQLLPLIVCWPDYRIYLSPEILYIPYQ